MTPFNAEKEVGGLLIQARLENGFISRVEAKLEFGLQIILDRAVAFDMTRRECASVLSLCSEHDEEKIVEALDADEDPYAGPKLVLELLNAGLALPKKPVAAAATESSTSTE